MLAEIQQLGNVIPVDITAGEQFDADFLNVNPNNKVPAIVDHDGPGGKKFPVFESGAILMYLAEKAGKLLPTDVTARWETIQWLMFQVSSMGPMLGQAHHFRVYAPEKIDYAVDRYTTEARRIYLVLENRLAGRDYLVDDYSIADISTFTWVRTRKMHGQDFVDYPNIERWYKTIKGRPAVHEGISVLSENKQWEAKPGSDEWRSMFSNRGD